MEWSQFEAELRVCDTTEEAIGCLKKGQAMFFAESTSTSNLTDTEKLTLSQSTGSRNELIFSVPAASKNQFYMNYTKYISLLLNSVAVKWLGELDNDTRKRFFFSVFIYGPVTDTFLGILACLKGSGHSKVIGTCLTVMEQFIGVGRLQQLIVEQCRTRTSVQLESLASYVCNLSAVLESKLVLGPCHAFVQDNYQLMLAKDIMRALERLQHHTSPQYSFAGKLLGKLSMMGDKEMVTRCVLEYVQRSHDNAVQISDVLCTIPSTCLEGFALPFLICDYISFDELKHYINVVFGSKLVLIGKLCTIFYHRFLFVRYFRSVRPMYLLFYPLTASEERRYLLTKSLLELLTIWGNKSSVEQQPYEQHVAICQCAVVCYYYMSQEEIEAIKDRLMLLLTAGMPVHLDSNNTRLRYIGMATAEIITSKINLGTDKALKFEYADNEDTLLLKSLMEGVPEEKLEEAPAPVYTDPEPESLELELDSDDDDLPVLNSQDEDLAEVKAPCYLRECIEVLKSRDVDQMQFEATMKVLPRLVARSDHAVEELALELVQLLLHLKCEFKMEEFSVLRIEALIMCCVRAPACIADYLCYQFYEENYTVVTRLDILEVLIGAARQLSIVKQDEKKEIEEVQRKEWEIEVMERVKNKTRYFNTPTKVVFGKENKFNKVCCHFFYALMAQYDKDIKTLSLGDEDSLLLGRLIYTLGIILHCAMSSPSAPLMSKSLLDFIKVFTAPRFAYLDDYIKQSILFSAGIIAHSATSSPELFIMLAPLRGWADDILTESSCYETSKLALHAINIMDNVIYNDIQIPQPESVSNEKAIFNVLQECSKVDITQLDQIQAQLESISLVKEKLNIH